MPSMRALLSGTVALFIALSATLMFAPWLILLLFGVPDDPSATFMSRRAALLFLGWACAIFPMRGVEDATSVRAIASGLAVSMLCLGVLGTAEFVRGYAGPGIFMAVVAELGLGVMFLLHARGAVTTRASGANT